MAVCEAQRPAPLRCPTRGEMLSAALALLPRGRAWQSNEGGPAAGVDVAFNPDAFQNDAFSTQFKRASTLWRFWLSVADVFTFLTSRLCDLRLEFWCATQKETSDLWLAEYGLPDACDPFPDLCAKVAAIGGTRCEYFADIAARSGWSISCVDQAIACGARVGCSRAGRGRSGRRQSASFVIQVDTGESPAFVGPKQRKARTGRFRARQHFGCDPDISPLHCVLERIVPAHIEIQYLLN